MAKRKHTEELKESDSVPVPTGLSVYAVTGSAVHLTWNMQPDTDTVHLERSTNGETWKEIMDTANGAYTDIVAENGKPLHYRLYASKEGERSGYSDVVVATTTPVVVVEV